MTTFRETKLRELLKTLKNWRFYATFAKKWPLGILRPFFVQKWHKIANFQNFQKNLLNFGALYGVVIWCKFQLIWTKIEGAGILA